MGINLSVLEWRVVLDRSIGKEGSERREIGLEFVEEIIQLQTLESIG